jgi:hypothetical protein
MMNSASSKDDEDVDNGMSPVVDGKMDGSMGMVLPVHGADGYP